MIVDAIKKYVPADAVAAAIAAWKLEFLDYLTAQAAATANGVDDILVERVRAALEACTPDSAFLCDLLTKGEAAVIAKLRLLAVPTPTVIDDALVDILEKALKPI